MRHDYLHKPLDRYAHVLVFGAVASIGWILTLEPKSPVGLRMVIAVAAALAGYVWLAYRFGAIQRLCACLDCGVTNFERSKRCRGCRKKLGWLAIHEYPIPAPEQIQSLANAQRTSFVVLFIFLSVLFVGRAAMSGYWIFITGASGACLLFAVAAWRSSRVRFAQRALFENEGALCPSCLYPLSEQMTQCPECGCPTSVRQAREQWGSANLWFAPRVTQAAAATSSSPSP